MPSHHTFASDSLPPITRSRVTCFYLTITGASSMAIDDQFEGTHVSVYQAAIGGKVLERHAARRETPLEVPADFFSSQLRKPVESSNRTSFILDDKARQSVVDDFPDGPAIKCNDRSPAGHRFDHDEAERLGKFVSGIQRQRWLLGACTKALAGRYACGGRTPTRISYRFACRGPCHPDAPGGLRDHRHSRLASCSCWQG